MDVKQQFSPALSRSLKASVSALGVMVLVAGCGQYSNPVTTELKYDAADGVSAVSGQVSAQNLMVATTKKDSPGKVVGVLENNGKTPATVKITIDGSATNVTIPAQTALRIGDNDAALSAGLKNGPEIMVPKVTTEPGGLVNATLTVEGGTAVSLRVPVMNSELPPFGDKLVEHEKPASGHGGSEDDSHGSGH